MTEIANQSMSYDRAKEITDRFDNNSPVQPYRRVVEFLELISAFVSFYKKECLNVSKMRKR